jgi:hypothetical protein
MKRKKVVAGKERRIQSLPCEGFMKAESSADGKPPKVSGVAYNGGKLMVNYWDFPVVVDLAGMKIPDKVRLDADHSRKVIDRLGSVAAQVEDGKLLYQGVMAGKSPTAENIKALVEAGETWEVSIDAYVARDTFIQAGKSVEANGQTFEGPIYLATETELEAISVVTKGADGQSTMDVAATATEQSGDTDMAEEKKDEKPPVEAEKKTDTPPVEAHADEAVKLYREKVQAEEKRIDGIREVCAKAEFAEVDRKVMADLRDKAIKAEIGVSELELGLLRAARPQTGNVASVSDNSPDDSSVEAALFMAAGGKKLEAYDEKTLAGARHLRAERRYGIKSLLLDYAWRNGCQAREVTDGNLRQVLRAAFSTQDVTDILNRVANKKLNEGFSYVEQTWAGVAGIDNVGDFKVHQRHRMGGNMQFEVVSKGGEIKHGELSESRYDVSVDTYGKMFSITRQDIINDDLGAFRRLEQMIGVGSGQKFNVDFWGVLNGASGSDFGADESDVDLTFAGLETAKNAFDGLEADGAPIGLEPTIILVPKSYELTALRLMATDLLITGANETRSSRDPLQGMFRVVSSRYLVSDYWYMLAEPAARPLIVASFLNGQQSPTIESTDADFNTLGIQFRGFWDYGAAMAEPLGGIRLAFPTS